ncbi:MAG TPA: DHA2 family efflux MFS transporter permease subunit, partial [Albitalea sp.]|nr:DHA2 family efflux MFS transporter permease subunit [Albitalea sp.]
MSTAAAAAAKPLHGSQLLLGTVALSLATFMNVLDSSIANVSIPAIAGDMGVSPSQGTWVITSFAVANAISVPLTGWLTQRFGQVRLFAASVLLFVLASWLCGLAPNIGMLIFFRVLQGLVAGPMIPLSQTLLLASYPAAKAGTAMAMWAMTVLVAPVVGPLLGGWITDNISWPWIFYINVPVGLVAAGLTWSIYRKRDPGPRRVPLDYVGLGLLVLWVGALQIMIDKGKELDWFASGQIVTLAIVAVVGFLFFLAWELTETHPIVDLRLFVQRNFLLGTLALSLGYGLFFGNVVLLPLWLQQYMGYTATWAGMAMAPVGVLAIMLSPWVGKNISRIDPRRLATVAFVGFGIVLWMRSRFNVQADFTDVMIPTVMQGAAMAFFFIPLQAIVFSGLPAQRMPAAAGLSNFVRITAGAFGTSIMTTLWDDRAQMHHAHIAETINRSNDAATATLNQLGAA